MPKLVYTVEVDSGDLETDTEYLYALLNVFRALTETLSQWGYTKDEVVSKSHVDTVTSEDNSG